MNTTLPYVTHYKNKERHFMTHRYAILGANTLIGHEILNILAEQDIAHSSVYALSSPRQSGRDLSYGDYDIKTLDASKFDFTNADIIFVCDEIYPVKSLLEKKITIIDCTKGEGIEAKNYIKMPSPNALQCLETLIPLHDRAVIKRVVIATYQATSHAGKAGMDELFNQSRKFFVSDSMENEVFAKQISFNVIPHVGQFADKGQTDSEQQLETDIQNHFGQNIKVAATCAIVPIFIGTGIALHVEFNDDMDVKTAKSLWRQAEDIVIIDEHSEMEYVTPAEIAGEDKVYLSRLRQDNSVTHGISYWCAADNIRFTAKKAVQAALAS
jgi:aspartate-semialdehyde dehydrogenase